MEGQGEGEGIRPDCSAMRISSAVVAVPSFALIWLQLFAVVL